MPTQHLISERRMFHERAGRKTDGIIPTVRRFHSPHVFFISERLPSGRGRRIRDVSESLSGAAVLPPGCVAEDLADTDRHQHLQKPHPLPLLSGAAPGDISGNLPANLPDRAGGKPSVGLSGDYEASPKIPGSNSSILLSGMHGQRDRAHAAASRNYHHRALKKGKSPVKIRIFSAKSERKLRNFGSFCAVYCLQPSLPFRSPPIYLEPFFRPHSSQMKTGPL